MSTFVWAPGPTLHSIQSGATPDRLAQLEAPAAFAFLLSGQKDVVTLPLYPTTDE